MSDAPDYEKYVGWREFNGQITDIRGEISQVKVKQAALEASLMHVPAQLQQIQREQHDQSTRMALKMDEIAAAMKERPRTQESGADSLALALHAVAKAVEAGARGGGSWGAIVASGVMIIIAIALAKWVGIFGG